MKIEVDSIDNGIVLKEVYSGVGLETRDGDKFGICMRDTGFEFNYGGIWYSAQNGQISTMTKPAISINNHTSTKMVVIDHANFKGYDSTIPSALDIINKGIVEGISLNPKDKPSGMKSADNVKLAMMTNPDKLQMSVEQMAMHKAETNEVVDIVINIRADKATAIEIENMIREYGVEVTSK